MRKQPLHTNKKIEKELFDELSLLVEKSQQQLVAVANSTLALLFWQIGCRINKEILNSKRADYGKQIVVTLSRQLQEKYGSNFEEKNLRRMLQFNEQFPDIDIVVTLSRQLSWSHFLAIIPIKNKETRLFYAEKAGLEMWGVRELRKNIAEKIFERTSIAKMQLQAENSSGLILCAETSREQIELLEMHKDGIMVAEYWTELPPKKELEEKLHKALIEAREQIEKRKLVQE